MKKYGPNGMLCCMMKWYFSPRASPRYCHTNFPSVLPFSTVIFFHDIFAPYCSHFVQFFGELALAYNKPRAATVVAESAGVLLSLDAKIFRRVIAQSARGRYDDIFEALKKVPLLWSDDENSNLNEQQLAKIAEIIEALL